MIRAIIRALTRIRNYERIPRLPRGMLASHYDGIAPEERRVIARMGARDPRGVRVAMRRARAQDVDMLVSGLQHHRARRRVRRRIDLMIGRWLRATEYPPHRREILQDERESKSGGNAVIAARIKRTMKEYSG
jgi:hypothetical protein